MQGRKTRGVKRRYSVRRNDEGEAQRRRWTFYEAIHIHSKRSNKKEEGDLWGENN
jgi:hypothetical protein